MSTRRKFQIASFTASVMMLLNVFSRPLGIPEAAQWVLIIGVFVPLGLLIVYSRRLRSERALGAAAQRPALRSARAVLVTAWVCGVACALAAPFWLPIAGAGVGTRGNVAIGVITAIVLSVVFGIRLKRTPNQPATGQRPWLLGNADAPLPVIDDPFLGRMAWSSEGEAWVGVRDGIRFGLHRDREIGPAPELMAYAKAVLADSTWLFSDFEREKQKWSTRVPPSAQAELANLKIGMISFSMRKGRGFIFAEVDGGIDGRCWRILWLHRKCDGLGFDS